ncbi:pectate lyase superfamily protein-domain-containing protein [Bombardia bombarda]|uniref:Pectate lyase superfamily protein-domain-containing protein n=1 Tax=Bombardia bombarda TaxID=252184 RepID=A0AA39WIU0_9PEZI|nr:pectate lyase superfamily protein-domain-containing protein [Bombardia bombarda]
MRTSLLSFTTLLVLVSASVAAHGADHGNNVMMHKRQQSCSNGLVASDVNPTAWWRAQIDHDGSTPYSSDPTFQYYRTAVQYGADRTGTNDSSEAFNSAIDAWSRTGNNVTLHPAYIYVPPGTYLIKRSIQMLVNTFLIGDALNPPTLVADPTLGTNPAINGYDGYQGEGSANKNFYMAVRNFNIDTTMVNAGIHARAMDWSVSQGCSLTNVHIKMPSGPSNHTGLTMEKGGSGVIISDCSFTGGAVGLELSNQQYMLKGLVFDGCGVGIYFKESLVTTIQGCIFNHCQWGVDMSRNGSSGSVSIVDSSVSSCTAGVNAYVSGDGEGSLVLDNFAVSDAIAVRSSAGATLLEGSVPAGQTWVMGNVNPQGYQSGGLHTINRPAGLLADGKYFTMPIPQYEKYDVNQFVSIKDDDELTVYGDNIYDDGPAINAILLKHAGCKIVFFPQGIYQTKETIYIPPGSRIVGEVLSVISGVGAHFSDPASPQPIVKVGNPGEKGIAQLTDMLFTTADVLPGAIVVQVNMAGTNPGDVGLWNCVIRVGGSVDSLVSAKCQGADPAQCKAAFALLHVGKTAGAYLEGFWGWVADHGLDDPSTPLNIAVGRGVLIESTSPTWLVGSSSEHCVLYQYSLVKASNVYMGLQQTESPYWQGRGTPQRAPSPWSVDADYGDPSFDNCAAQGQADNDQCYRSWASRAVDSSGVVVHGSAMWVFFNRMNDNMWQDAGCESTGGFCQLNMALVDGAVEGLYWYSLSSKSTTNIVYDSDGSGGGGSVATQEDNRGSWGAVVAAYLRESDSDGSGSGGAETGDGSGNSGSRDKSAGGLAANMKGLLFMGAGLVHVLTLAL